METDLKSYQQLVHQKVGSNLLRIQRLERMLKFLTSINGFEAPLATFQCEFAARMKRVERMPFGHLVERVAKAVFTSTQSPMQDHSTVQQAMVRFTFSIEDTGSLMKDWRKQHRNVVRERNRLVHRFIDDCDLRTVQGCEASVSLLGQQRERLTAAAQSIESMVNAVREAFEDIQSGKAEFTRA
jgi:hypothetical protein